MMSDEEKREFFAAFQAGFKLLEGEHDAGAYIKTKKKTGNPPFERKETRMLDRRMIAYDLETTNIAVGTPSPLYITAFSEAFNVSKRLSSFIDLRVRLEEDFLTEENSGVRFVAWNANKFDVYLVCAALSLSDRWEIYPSMTRSKAVRSVKIVERVAAPGKKKLSYQFCDGMAMTGHDAAGTSLKKFLATYAPDYAKLELDFSKESFDVRNVDHVRYAERDSEGLYHAMMRVDAQMLDLTGNGLQTTLGRAAIAYFQKMMPLGVKVWKAPKEIDHILHNQAKRGGYVWADRQYQGPVWKYDLNQAYAAAMRDCALPCGSLSAVTEFQSDKPGLYRVRLSRAISSPVPFYCKRAVGSEALYICGSEPIETYILSNEIEHLRKEGGWSIEIISGDVWEASFNMADMVSHLEQLRFSDPLGPSGPLGWICKSIGNMGYGKTLELLDGVSYLISAIPPGGDWELQNIEAMDGVYRRRETPQVRAYHRPQIGCFVTAHVRCVVRDAVLMDHEHFVYADTDCVMLSRPADFLDIDPRRYGAWKIEAEGTEHIVIAKKVYCGPDETRIHAKGLRTRELTRAKMIEWKAGKIPSQTQLQRNNMLAFMSGKDMFRSLDREGTNVRRSKTVSLSSTGKFVPIVKEYC